MLLEGFSGMPRLQSTADIQSEHLTKGTSHSAAQSKKETITLSFGWKREQTQEEGRKRPLLSVPG